MDFENRYPFESLRDTPLRPDLGPAGRRGGGLGAEVAEVFALVWPAANVQLREDPPGYAVDLRLESLVHSVSLPAALAAEGAGLRLVRQLFKQGVPRRLAQARVPQRVTLAGDDLQAGR